MSYYNDVRAMQEGLMKRNKYANTTLTRAGLISILRNGANLIKLNISDHDGLKLDSSDARSLPGWIGLPKLTHLNASHASGLNDDSLTLILKHSPVLIRADLEGCSVADRTVLFLSQHCPNLQHLVTPSKLVTDQGLRALSASCRCLQHLDIGGCDVTDKAVASLVAKCNALKHIHLKRIGLIGDLTVRALAEHCPLLEYFAVGRGGMEVQTAVGRSLVTDTSLKRLVKNCPRMHTFNLTDCCDLLTSVKAMAQHSPLLRRLTLTGNSNVSEEDIISLSLKCPLFEYIDAEKCVNITDRAVVSLAQNCRHLTYLNVSYCTRVTDVSVRCVAKNCPQLLSLTLNSCKAVTAPAVLEVLDACPGLTKFMCFGMKKSLLVLQSVLVNCPFMVVLGLYIDTSVDGAYFMQVARQVNMALPRLELLLLQGNN
eukprot:gene29583-36658_t